LDMKLFIKDSEKVHQSHRSHHITYLDMRKNSFVQ